MSIERLMKQGFLQLVESHHLLHIHPRKSISLFRQRIQPAGRRPLCFNAIGKCYLDTFKEACLYALGCRTGRLGMNPCLCLFKQCEFPLNRW